MQVSITGHESGTIYKVTNTEGKVLRADLGKNGGRMLSRHPFTVIGELQQDENGELIKMESVEYKDPLVMIEKAAGKAASEQSKTEAVNARDNSYNHVLSRSHNKHYLTYNNTEDVSGYKQVKVADVGKEQAGSKISFVGSAVSTVTDDTVMKFWGGANLGGFVNVVMNGAYIPLGQRSTVYGTVNDDGTVSLLRFDSIE